MNGSQNIIQVHVLQTQIIIQTKEKNSVLKHPGNIYTTLAVPLYFVTQTLHIKPI